jgi:MipA family protein
MRFYCLSYPRRRRLSVHGALGAILPPALLATSMQFALAQENATAGDVHNDWNILAGAGAINQPRYPGSRFDFTHALPAVSISYDRYFFGGAGGAGAPAGIGAYLLRSEHWTFGLDVGGDLRKPRRASDELILHGWGDIPETVRGGMFASYSMEWLSAHVSASEGGHHEGVKVSLNLDAELHPTSHLTLSFGPEVTWTDEQYAMTFFGIDAAQSKIAGIPPYRVRAGVNTIGVEAGGRYALTNNWLLVAHVNVGRLQGDAANSPVTTDKTQREFGAFVLYRF